MRQHKAVKGQILILIILALIALVVIFGVISIFSGRQRTTPIVTQAFWAVEGQTVTTLTLGDDVAAHVRVQARGEYVGTIVVRIKKDISLWFDSDYHIATIPVNLKGSEEEELDLEFTPDQASGGSLRGYFIEVEFSLTRTKWTMENSYPPRLSVQEPKL